MAAIRLGIRFARSNDCREVDGSQGCAALGRGLASPVIARKLGQPCACLCLGGVVVVTSVAIIGAGPNGLSIAAHLRARGISYRIFGTPVDTWRRHMPAGMMLKSDGFASNLCGPDGQGTLAAYCAERGIPYHPTKIAVSLELFIDYALDFQQRFVPDVEDRQVVAVDKAGDGFTLTLDGGETFTADFVVGAVGITHFGQIPD